MLTDHPTVKRFAARRRAPGGGERGEDAGAVAVELGSADVDVARVVGAGAQAQLPERAGVERAAEGLAPAAPRLRPLLPVVSGVRRPA